MGEKAKGKTLREKGAKERLERESKEPRTSGFPLAMVRYTRNLAKAGLPVNRTQGKLRRGFFAAQIVFAHLSDMEKDIGFEEAIRS